MNVAKPAAVSAAVVAAMLAAAAWAWPHAPAQLPTHWGVGGAPDRWSPKAVALLLHPALATALSLMFALLPAIMPKAAPLERSARAYGTVWIGIVLLLGVVQLVVAASALGRPVDVVRVVGAAVGVLLAILGDLMGKMRRNYVMGVRTPWTLADERVWDRTHRAVGPWFMAWGVLIAAASLLGGGPALAGTAVAGALVVGGGAVAYSYLVARRLGTA